MSASWPKVRLGEVLRRSEETTEIQPDAEYREVTVRLWGKGVVERGRLAGAEISANRRAIARTGQFVASRIDARNGAMGIVPAALDGAVVTNDFPLFAIDARRLLPAYLGWLCRTSDFVELCLRASEGTTNRIRLKEERFLALEIPLPPLAEQCRIVARIDEFAAHKDQVEHLRVQIGVESDALLTSVFMNLVAAAPCRKMEQVAPVVRRPVEVVMDTEYPELGIRSFGKGTFHKPALDFLSVGSKRIFRIEPGDLVFSNVFAWEGGTAVAQSEDAERFGSHRFITCVPDPAQATADFLCFYFLTPAGLEKIGKASPGGAGRNRTLGVEKLAKIEVPIPALKEQLWFGSLLAETRRMRNRQTETAAELDALLPSILNRAFSGAL